MNSKLVITAVLAVALLGIGGAMIAGSDDSAATIDDGNNYGDDYEGVENYVNFSDLCLVLGVILLIGAGIIVYMAIYTKLYGDF